jgi:serine/threonine protein kinase
MQQATPLTAAPLPPLPPPPPDITASGRYQFGEVLRKVASGALPAELAAEVPEARPSGRLAQLPSPPSESELLDAARSWDDASSAIGASYEVLADGISESTVEMNAVIRPPAGAVLGGITIEPLQPAPPEPRGARPSKATAQLVSPQAARERKDLGIRKMLGVPEDATEFDFGPYRILGEVASGGMGIIYRARDGNTGQVYALKALLNVENASEKQLRRFIQEAQSAMRLDHPGIVKIHDLGILENIPYFTMDLVDGYDLHHHLRKKTFDLDKLLDIFCQTCEAVHYAHEGGVIHRDLKPANIIVRRADTFPVLTDFGLAKNLDSSFKLTAEGAMVGTPLYLSPEQVAGKAQEVDRRCDVYGLGVMLYQILTSKLPFIGRNPYEVYKKVLEEDPTPPTQVNAAIAPDLEKICLMALAKSRDERYDSAQDMADDLRRFLRGEPVQAKLPTPAAVSRAKTKAPQSKKRSQRGAQPAAQEGSNTTMIVFIAGFVVLFVLGVSYIVYLLATTPAE